MSGLVDDIDDFWLKSYSTGVSMDNGGGLGPLGIRNWPYYEPPLKNNLGLQLMSSVGDRERKPLISSSNGFPVEFVRDGWFSNRETNSDNMRFFHAFSSNPSYALNASANQTIQMLQSSNLQPKNELISTIDEPEVEEEEEEEEDVLFKKRPQGQTHKSQKPKKHKKVPVPKNEISQRRARKKSEELLINGIDLDLSKLPTPVCSCTGKPQQCYRWGVGGWQSACCTKSVSIYPLPLSTKRKGARIAGRKMSLGAFKKVLETLAGEGYNLSNPIDLKPYWAKHGTNKFVTIR